jgi:hypothetical protein
MFLFDAYEQDFIKNMMAGRTMSPDQDVFLTRLHNRALEYERRQQRRTARRFRTGGA